MSNQAELGETAVPPLEPTMSRYEQLLRNYATILDLEPVSLLLATQEIVVNDVTVSLMLDGDANTGDVVFCTNLGIPAHPAQVHTLMLQANALWAGTGGCTLGLQHGTGAVLLAGRTPLPLCHARLLADMLSAFADISRRWKAVIVETTPLERRVPLAPGNTIMPTFV